MRVVRVSQWRALRASMRSGDCAFRGVTVWLVGVMLALAVAALAVARDGGGLDASFDGDGVVMTDLGGSEAARALALTADGRIVVAGGAEQVAGASALLVLRYLPDGSLDRGFGADGAVRLAGASIGYAVALQPDGKIVVAGQGGGNAAVARLLTDGSLDPTFSGGLVSSDWGGSDVALAVAVQPDGKIVLAGRVLSAGQEEFAVARLAADGSRDGSFGAGGVVRLDTGGRFERLQALAIQPDGKIVAAGWRYTSRNEFVVLRLNADGSLDRSFGSRGIVADLFGGAQSQGQTALLAADGRIVVAGTADDGIGVARLRADGTLDPAFGSGGKEVLAGRGEAMGIAPAGNGRILLGGDVRGAADSDLTAVRLLPNGAVDPTFAPAVTNGRAEDYAFAAVLQPDGKAIVAGMADALGRGDVLLVRYLGSACVAPRVVGTSAAAAKAALARASCSLGRSTTARSKTVRKGLIVSQKPAAGATLADGAAIDVVVSRGPR